MHLLSHSSPAQLCQLRRLNKFFKLFISANKSAILRPMITHHRARINARGESLLQIAGLGFRTALGRFFSYYGCIGNNDALTDVIDSFCKQYVREAHSGASGVPQATLEGYFAVTAKVLCMSGRMPGPATDMRERLSQRIDEFFSNLANQTGDHITMESLQSTDLFVGPCYTEKLGAPIFFLTPRAGCIGRSTRVERGKYRGISEDAATMLGLPSFGPNQLFAYCVKTLEICQLVFRAWESGTPLCLFEEAAVLEETFIW